MSTVIPLRSLWSETQPEHSCLIMGNSPSLNLFDSNFYDNFYTIGCNSRIFTTYSPDLTLMVDEDIPTPPGDADIASHLRKWQEQHMGTCYSYRLGGKLQFHPDLSDSVIDYAITSAYMAICVAYQMGYRTIHIVGVDLGEVNGKDYHDGKDPVSESRKRFFGVCYNHLSYLINKLSKYHGCQFYCLSPYSQLLQNGYVKRYN